jgi:tRNA(fMet)-specific endonuclease VapC
MQFVLDTSAYSEFNRGDERLRKWFRIDNDIVIPAVVVGELRAGFALGSKREENDYLLQRFLDSPNVSLITITDNTTKFYAEIYFRLRRKGKPVGTNDMWIAAMALEQDAVLLTMDSDFSNISDLVIATI